MRKRFDYVSRGLLLIALGIVFLLINYHVLSWGFWWNLADIWPLLLVLGGIALLFNRRIPISAVLLVFLIILIVYSLFWEPHYNWRFDYHRHPVHSDTLPPSYDGTSSGRF